MPKKAGISHADYKERDASIVAAWRSGATKRELAAIHGLTAQRIYYILVKEHEIAVSVNNTAALAPEIARLRSQGLSQRAVEKLLRCSRYAVRKAFPGPTRPYRRKTPASASAVRPANLAPPPR